MVGGGALALTLVPAGIAQASAPIKVTNLHDTGTNSLRWAIGQANLETTTESDPAVITFGSKLSGSIDLKSQLPDVTQSIEIEGPGARKLELNAAAIPRNPGDAVIYDKTSDTELTISGLSMDRAYIFNFDGVFLEVNSAELVLIRDTFADDRGSYFGGALEDFDNELIVDGCTFTGDRAYDGGAIAGSDAEAEIKDSTFVGNHAAYDGGDGGALNFDESFLEIDGSTVTGNSAHFADTSTTRKGGYGGGLAVGDVFLGVYDSIMAGNSATGNVRYTGHPYGGSDHRDIYATDSALTADFSLIGHDYRGLAGYDGHPALNSTDILGVSPDLGPLRNNGGPTNTELPFAKSPVINAGKKFGLKTDQRGDKRTVDYPHVKKRKGSDGTDIGAVELQRPKRRH
jgi:hypothetical protein